MLTAHPLRATLRRYAPSSATSPVKGEVVPTERSVRDVYLLPIGTEVSPAPYPATLPPDIW
jgi:hypothetical protein